MKEALLHSIWKTKNFDCTDLETTDGDQLKIKNFGIHNYDSGPDFLDGRVVIANTTWAGHIELHIKSSDWQAHKHQNDPAYNNVILHVVYENDKIICNQNGQQIPTLELKNRMPLSYEDGYNKLINSQTWVPCANHLSNVNKDKLPFFLERLLIQRLERKQTQINLLLEQTNNNWEEVLYRLILKYFGLKVNAEAFEKLAGLLPHSLLTKQESTFKKESLLFGLSGILKIEDDYVGKLKTEFNHLKAKYDLTPLSGVEWKYSRMRPANFPSVRLAQIAALFQNTPQVFNTLISEFELTKLKEIFNVQLGEYWNTHYVPGKKSASKKKTIGAATIDTLIINVFAPIVFCYAVKTANEKLKHRALNLLNDVKAENNTIIRHWKELGLQADSAARTQSLIELKNEYCQKQNCLNCQIGQQIIFS